MVDRACSMNGSDEKCIQRFSQETWREKTIWKDNIKMDFKELVCEGVDCTHVVQDRVQQWTPVNTVTNLLVS